MKFPLMMYPPLGKQRFRNGVGSPMLGQEGVASGDIDGLPDAVPIGLGEAVADGRGDAVAKGLGNAVATRDACGVKVGAVVPVGRTTCVDGTASRADPNPALQLL
jgi:hypothetical protein